MERVDWSGLGAAALVLAVGCGNDPSSESGGAAGATSTGGTGGVAAPLPPVCDPAPSGLSGAVPAPVLRATLPGSWDENWLASPALVDVDGDGAADIVAPRHSVLYVYRGDGTPLWQTAWGYGAAASPEHGDVRMWPSAVAGDLDGDGATEIAVSSSPDGAQPYDVAVYDAQGGFLPGWPQRFGDTELRSIAAADVDGDGQQEVLVTKQADGPATDVFDLDGTTAPGFPVVGARTPPRGDVIDYGGFNQNTGAGDVDGDGLMEVISTYDAIGFGVFDGDGTPLPAAPDFADAWITGVEAYHDPALSLQGWGTGDRSEFTYSPPVVADVDADGAMEFVLAGDHESSESTDNQGITVWVLNQDLTRPAGWEWPKNSGMPLVYDGDLGPNIVPTYPAPAVADLDGQPGLEIVVPAYDGLLYAFRSTGEVLWTYRFNDRAQPYVGASEALIVDLNRDGSPEIVFDEFSSGQPGTPDTPAYLVILDAAGRELQKVGLSGRGSMAAPAVADLDGDGELELVVSLKDSLGGGLGGVQIWDLTGSAPNCVLWGTGRGGPLRQGYLPPGP